MSLLSDFEDRVSAAVEGVFAGVFRSPVQPAELARALAKQMERQKVVGVGKVYAPTLYTVLISEADDEKLVDLALMHAVAPAYKKLFNHPRIVANPTIADLAQQIEFKVFPGEFPGTMDTALTQYIGQNIVAGTSIDQSLQEAQQACDAAMQEQEYWVVERTYIHDDAMIPNQP